MVLGETVKVTRAAVSWDWSEVVSATWWLSVAAA